MLSLATAGGPQAGVVSETTSLVTGLPSLVNALVQVVNGAVGGVLSRGMWTAQIPAGAFSGTATLSLSTQAATPNVCQLGISPADKNAFAKPVVLTAKIPLTMAASSAQIQWYNPQTQAWEAVPGSSVNALARTVSAPLWHFSTYRVDGRNGW